MNIWFTSNYLCVPKTQGNESRLPVTMFLSKMMH
jgi:hypothetical protein